MIEYKGKDSKEIGEALKTLILICAKNKGYELDCTISFGETMCDCHFEFKLHKEGEEE